MARSVRLRRWQKQALDQLGDHAGPDFLAVATPGAGKTTFALTAAVQHLAANPGRPARGGGADQPPEAPVDPGGCRLRAAPRAAVGVDAPGGCPADMHGIVVTYQQVATNPGALRRHAERCLRRPRRAAPRRRRAGLGRRPCAWRSSAPPRRLAISGTPFRSDTHAIPFVSYHLDEARPDYEYGYDAGAGRPARGAAGVVPPHRRLHGVDRARRRGARRQLRRRPRPAGVRPAPAHAPSASRGSGCPTVLGAGQRAAARRSARCSPTRPGS